MPLPARNTLAVLGAGPIGLEAAFAGLDLGLDVHVFERGEVAAHLRAWGHVRMFTPWRRNLGPATRSHLESSGWTSPPADESPTGLELAERALEPASRLAEIAGRIHVHSQVVHLSRRGRLKGDDAGHPEHRREHPFRIMVRNPGGRDSYLHAFALVDATGTYGQPNWAGEGGIPARQETYLAPQMSYHVDDVLGLRRERYAGKQTLVIGGGLSAATVVRDLATLAADSPGTGVVWATRRAEPQRYTPIAGDPLEGRRGLMEDARGFLRGGHPAVRHVGGVTVEGFEFNSATHRYRVTLMRDEQGQVEEVDHVIVNAGFGPDDSLYRELQVHECYASRGLMKLAATLLDSGSDCLKVPVTGVEALLSPEPDFYVVGAKSYGRNSTFLLETGYRQVADVLARLAQDAAKPVGA